MAAIKRTAGLSAHTHRRTKAAVINDPALDKNCGSRHDPTIGQVLCNRRLVTGNCKSLALGTQVGEIPTFT